MLDVDPTLELLATGCCDDLVAPHLHWHDTLLTAGGETLTSIALHALPSNTKHLDDHVDLDWLWHTLMAHPTRWEKVDLPALLQMARELAPGRTVDLSITEWGILGDTQRPQVGNLGGAMYAALFLNMAVRQHEVIRVANATALMHGGALRKAGPFTYYDPQVEVIRRYTTLSGGTRLPLTYQGAGYDVERGIFTVPSVNDVPWIDAVAVQQNGTTTVAIVNRSATDAQELTLHAAADGTVRPNTFEVMTGHTRAMNTPFAPEQVIFAPQPLPAAGAFVTLHLPPRAIGWLRCTLD
jgi:alpha-L-arabinofuranosidase